MSGIYLWVGSIYCLGTFRGNGTVVGMAFLEISLPKKVQMQCPIHDYFLIIQGILLCLSSSSSGLLLMYVGWDLVFSYKMTLQGNQVNMLPSGWREALLYICSWYRTLYPNLSA